jgi:hypothetical protein
MNRNAKPDRSGLVTIEILPDQENFFESRSELPAALFGYYFQ